jgi:hypothetical protein
MRTTEGIVAKWEAESSDRLMDRFEYYERVVYPSMTEYAREACEEFITWYAKKYEMKFTNEFKERLVDEFLNQLPGGL